MLRPTLELLNSNMVSEGMFDIPKLLEIIPDNWSIKLTSNFLLNILNSNVANKNKNLIQKNIYSNYKFSLKQIVHDLRKELLYVDDDR